MKIIRIDSKTILQIPDTKDIEETRQTFLEKLKLSREKEMRSRISYFING